jgi:hypothetical protein
MQYPGAFFVAGLVVGGLYLLRKQREAGACHSHEPRQVSG